MTIYRLDANRGLRRSALYAYDFPGKYQTPGTIRIAPSVIASRRLKGVRVPARPHLGTAGVALDAVGRVSTVPPGARRQHRQLADRRGGHDVSYPGAGRWRTVLDRRSARPTRATASSAGTAIESSLDVLFQIVLRKDFKIASPLLETPKWWIVHGFNDDLNVAMRTAPRWKMLGLLTDHVGLSRKDAYSLMSVATDFAVTQVVDGRQGVHVRAPRSIFPARDGATGET